MVEKVVDCRGFACPIPVLKTKEALEKVKSGVITVIVDNRASKENVKKFAEKMGCSVSIEEREGNFYMKIVKEGESLKQPSPAVEENRKKGDYAVLIASTYVGEDRELGEILIKGFIKTFLNAEPLPSKIVLINTAVKFACRSADSEILQSLKELADKGVEIICCGTCLGYFNLLDNLEVGTVSNAYDVVQSLSSSKNIIRL